MSMIDEKFFKALSSKFSQDLPDSLLAVKSEIQKHFLNSVDHTITKLNLVTREEFDIQVQVLAKTRQKLAELELLLSKHQAKS